MERSTDERFVPRWQIAERTGAVVVVDVIRAFTTAAYAFAAGARQIYLVDTVDEALQFKAEHAGVIAMGENHGRRPVGFDLSNSPVAVSQADLDGRTLVQRTSAGTRGVVCASATAAAVAGSGLGPPTYVISGRSEDRPGRIDDLLTAQLIERARTGQPLAAEATAAAVAASDEARTALALGDGYVDQEDIVYAARVDAFDFAMEVERLSGALVLRPHRAP